MAGPGSPWVCLDNGFDLKVRRSDGALRCGANAVATHRVRTTESVMAFDAINALLAKGGHHRLAWQRPLVKGVLADPVLEARVWEAALGKAHGARAIVTAHADSPLEAVAAVADLALGYFRCAEVQVVRPQVLALVNAYVRPHHYTVWQSLDDALSDAHAAVPATPGATRAPATPAAASPCPADAPRAAAAPPLTGVVVDVGATSTSVAVFVAGREVPSARRGVHVGGQTVAAALHMALKRRYPTHPMESHVVNAMKERACEVAACVAVKTDEHFIAPYTPAPEDVLYARAEKRKREAVAGGEPVKKARCGRHRRLVYSLPDHEGADCCGYVVPPEALAARRDDAGQFITVMDEVHAAAELFFHPCLAGLGRKKLQGGVVEAVVEAVAAAPPLYRAALWGNVVMAGGAAQTKGLKERLYAELRRAAPAAAPLVLRHPSPAHAAAAAADGGMCVANGRLQRALEHDGAGALGEALLPPAVTHQQWAKDQRDGKKGAARAFAKHVESMWAHR
eukprot:TRINITY_DN13706_c0_g1_i1.p2 TRINITY_DN13706_c0_g1~~TRINITY_DN13706_c0_g1_i1.p2  ORF type:complete len:510 (+),score=196.28 TRINITY_DN13706_c0_g1_i1:114-1643(+)